MFLKICAFCYAIFYFFYFLIKYNFYRYFDVTIVSAVDEMNDYGIGYEGCLQWNIPSDMKFFKKTTIDTKKLFNKVLNIKNILICGSNTFESLKRKNLPGRHMIVITSNPMKFINNDMDIIGYDHGFVITKNQYDEYTIFIDNMNVIHYALKYLSKCEKGFGKIFVIGGATIYEQFLIKKIRKIKVKECILSFVGKAANFTPRFNRIYDTFFPFNCVLNDFKKCSMKKISNDVSVYHYSK